MTWVLKMNIQHMLSVISIFVLQRLTIVEVAIELNELNLIIVNLTLTQII